MIATLIFFGLLLLPKKLPISSNGFKAAIATILFNILPIFMISNNNGESLLGTIPLSIFAFPIILFCYWLIDYVTLERSQNPIDASSSNR